MFGSRRRAPRQPQERQGSSAFTLNDADQIQSAYNSYTRRVLGVVAFNAAALIFFWLILWWMQFLSTLGKEHSLVPALFVLSGPTFLAAIGVVVVIVTALNVMARVPVGAPVNHPAAGRRMFLTNLARLMVLASLGLGVFGSVNGLARMPDEFDLVRILGPIGVGVVIALFAADASIAEDDGIDKAIVAEANERAASQRFSAYLEALVGASSKPKGWVTTLGVLLLASPPILLVVILQFYNPSSNLVELVGRLGFTATLAVVTYAVILENYRVTVRGEWSLVGLSTVFPIVFMSLMVIGTAAAVASAPKPTYERLAWGVGYMLACFALPAVAGLLSLRARPRGVLRHIAVRLAQRQQKRIALRVKKLKVPINPLAVVSLVLCLFFPFGPILAIVAIEQIRANAQRTPPVKQGGVYVARVALWVSGTALALCFVALFWLGIQGN